MSDQIYLHKAQMETLFSNKQLFTSGGALFTEKDSGAVVIVTDKEFKFRIEKDGRGEKL